MSSPPRAGVQIRGRRCLRQVVVRGGGRTPWAGCRSFGAGRSACDAPSQVLANTRGVHADPSAARVVLELAPATGSVCRQPPPRRPVLTPRFGETSERPPSSLSPATADGRYASLAISASCGCSRPSGSGAYNCCQAAPTSSTNRGGHRQEGSAGDEGTEPLGFRPLRFPEVGAGGDRDNLGSARRDRARCGRCPRQP